MKPMPLLNFPRVAGRAIAFAVFLCPLTSCRVPTSTHVVRLNHPGSGNQLHFSKASSLRLTPAESEEADQKSKRRLEKASGAREMALQRGMERRDDSGVVPPNALMIAKAHADAMPAPPGTGQTRDAGLSIWEWLGPGNIGGRARSAVIHPTQPSTMWIGAVSGGIWKTTNGGVSWQPVNDFLPSLAVSSLVIHPVNPNIMYAGTGESFGGGLPGAGVLKSTDGGNTWAQLLQTIPTSIDPTQDDWAFVNRLSVSPNDPDVILAATDSGIWRSSNAGASWTRRTFDRTTDVKFRPLAASTRAVAGLGDGTILYSSDLGQTWNYADISGTVFSTALSIAFTADLDTTDDVLAAQSTAGLAMGDHIRVGLAGAGQESTIVREVVTGNTLRVRDLSFNHGLLAPLATHNGDPVTATLSGGFIADGDQAPDQLVLGSNAGFLIGDNVRVGSSSGAETVRVVGLSGSTGLLVDDLENSHSSGQPVRASRAGRTELAWGTGGVAYASADKGGGIILKSTDLGASFSPIADAAATPNYLGSAENANVSQGWWDNTIWVSPTDNDFIVVGGVDLWRDEDVSTGLSLSRISTWQTYHTGGSAHADQHMIVAHPSFNGSTNKTVFVVNDGGIQRSSDITALPILDSISWTNLANNLGITQFYGGATNPLGEIFIGGAQDNGIMHHPISGTPQDWHQSLTGDGGKCAVTHDYPFPAVLYQTTQRLTVWKSENGGLTYGLFPATNGLLDAGTDNALFVGAPLVMDPLFEWDLYAGGTSLWHTVTDADLWTQSRPPLAGDPKCTEIDVAWCCEPVRYKKVWVGYDDGRISKLDSAGWTDLDDNNGIDPLPNRWITGIHINPDDSNEVFVTIGGYATDTVWRTADGGTTWQSRNGTPPYDLPPVQINTVTAHPRNPEWIYIGTDVGIFASEDGGLRWNRTPSAVGGDHDGPASTEVSELYWHGEHLVAATFGRGMYQLYVPTVVYVDRTNIQPGCEDGTQDCPFNTLAEGIAAQPAGAAISIESNLYNEANPGSPIIFTKRGDVTATNGTVEIR